MLGGRRNWQRLHPLPSPLPQAGEGMLIPFSLLGIGELMCLETARVTSFTRDFQVKAFPPHNPPALISPRVAR